MAKFTSWDNVGFEAFKVYGVEERDAFSINVLVENELINDRFIMTRDEYKKILPSDGDFLVFMPDEPYKFINVTELDRLLAGEKATAVVDDASATIVSDTPAIVVASNVSPVPLVGSVVIPSALGGDPDNLLAKILDESVTTSGVSSTDGSPTSSTISKVDQLSDEEIE